MLPSKIMKFRVLFILFAVAFVPHSWAISVDVNWPEFMARQDPVWDRLPVDYYEGPFVGNGLLGTILFADDQQPFQVYLRVATSGTDGKYRIPYAFSDEYGPAEETSMNIALAQWGFRTLIQCAERLKIEDPLLPKWKEMLEKMADYNIDANGIMIGKNTPFAKPHRHYSHLFGIFPLYTLNIDRDADRIPLMKKSIQHFTDLDGDNCMFKFTGASSLWASTH